MPICQWMSRWKWLLYLKIVDGAFCRYCLMFSSVRGGKYLVRKPFSKWKDTVEHFDKHEEISYHKSNKHAQLRSLGKC